MATTHILLVDDHPLIISGLQNLLSRNLSPLRLSLARSGAEALEIINYNIVNLVITDWDMPGLSGYDVAEYSISKGIPTIVLTSFTDIVYLLEMEALGVGGIMLKNMDDDELLEAIKKVQKGERYFHPKVFEILNKLDNLPELSFRLTKREKELLKYLQKGILQKNIADHMFVEIKTVEKHVANIKRKMQVENITQAVLKAMELGILGSTEILPDSANLSKALKNKQVVISHEKSHLKQS